MEIIVSIMAGIMLFGYCYLSHKIISVNKRLSALDNRANKIVS